MTPKRLWSDRDAVSPVIGVILMVAITVILAAVIASFVMGLGQQQGQAQPTASFNFKYDEANNELEITHNGGDSLETANIEVILDGSTVTSPVSGWPDTEIQAGDGFTVGSVSSSSTVRVVWKDPQSDKSAELASWQGPDA